jgi:hypothetical protein
MPAEGVCHPVKGFVSLADWRQMRSTATCHVLLPRQRWHQNDGTFLVLEAWEAEVLNEI